MKLRHVLFGVLVGAAALACSPTTLLAQGPPPPPPPEYQGGPPSEPWAAPPPEFQDVQRRGFHDGVEGARRDFANHRPPNVNNREEYRHPNLPGPLRRDYREAFRRGYQAGVEHTYGDRGRRPD